MTTLTSEQIPSTWCRMWNEDASLAHQLITDDGRWWSGVQAGPDALVGPAATEALVAGYQVEVGTTFVPRTLVIEGADRLAYTWDATRRDGTVITGADVCVLRDGKVVRNWTIPGERQSLTADPAGATVTPARARTLVDDWTRLWNGETGLAPDLVTDDFSVFFGAVASAADDLRGPDAPTGMASYVERFRSTRAGLTFAPHGVPVVDEARGTVAVTWSAAHGDRSLGGIDVFTVVDDRVARCWSFTGQRAHVLDGPA